MVRTNSAFSALPVYCVDYWKYDSDEVLYGLT